MIGIPFKKTLWAVLGLGLSASALAAPLGKVILGSGEVQIVRGETAVPATVGALLNAGDILRTGAVGNAQLSLVGGTVIALHESTELVMAEGEALQLRQGGMRLINDKEEGLGFVAAGITVHTGPGFSHVAVCAQDCGSDGPGVFLKGAVSVDGGAGPKAVPAQAYVRVANAQSAPEVLMAPPRLLVDKLASLSRGEARGAALARMKEGVQAYVDKDYAKARPLLLEAQKTMPTNPTPSYYLGLIAMEGNQQGEAIRQWQQYEKLDPQGAQAKGVSQQLTLLVSESLRVEIQKALENEKQLSKLPPEPNSVAVQAFANKGGEKYKALSKGITAILVSDLSQVPGLKVLERAKLQKLMDEIRLAESGLADPNTAVRAGKILHAEKMVIGDFEVK